MPVCIQSQVPSSRSSFWTQYSTVYPTRKQWGQTGSRQADITLVWLLKARYWAESCETRCTKPFPAMCLSQSCWAFSLSLLNWASWEANSSSTDCERTGTLAQACSFSTQALLTAISKTEVLRWLHGSKLKTLMWLMLDKHWDKLKELAME